MEKFSKEVVSFVKNNNLFITLDQASKLISNSVNQMNELSRKFDPFSVLALTGLKGAIAVIKLGNKIRLLKSKKENKEIRLENILKHCRKPNKR